MPQSLVPGQTILDKYRIERLLGRGGMGDVFAARHLHLDELFAIKVLYPHAAKRSTAVERFVREARAAARLKSEHIMRVHDVGTFEDGVPYMVMEYLDGHDLSQELAKRGPLPVADATLYVIQTCEGMLEAHAHGIVHRDLKPLNLVLVRLSNGLSSIKVLDFGISKMVEPLEGQKEDLTETGVVIGSPRYMSPEQFINGKAADIRSDIWAIGVIFYELLLGRPPYQGDNLFAQLRAFDTAPASLHAARADVPEELEAIIFKCLEKHPRDRYQSVTELLTALLPFTAAGPGAYVPSAPTTANVAPLGFHGRTATLPLVEVPEAIENGLSEKPSAEPTSSSWEMTRSGGPLDTAKKRWIAVAMAVSSIVSGSITGVLWGMPSKTEANDAQIVTSAPSATMETPTIVNSALPITTSATTSTSVAVEPAVLPSKPAKVVAPAPRIRKTVPGHESND